MATRSKKLGGSSKGVYNYLTDAEVTMRYYEGFKHAFGGLAEEFGLTDGVTREQFERLFAGQHPITGEQLAKGGYKRVENEDGTVEMVATRTPMIDVVYGAPKSLAVLYVAATPELRKQLDEVLLEAARAAHEAMEDTAKLARVTVKTPTEVGGRSTKQQGSATERRTAKLLALPVIQYTARPTEESQERLVPVDPHIHVHVPIFTLCQADGRWLTADEFGMKNRTNAKLRDAVFMGELARGLEALGIKVRYDDFERSKGGELRWEVDGTDPKLMCYWSTNNERAWRIRREYEEKHGKPIDEAKLSEILYATRRHKTKAVKLQDSHPNWELWRQDAEQAGFRLPTVKGRESRELRGNVDELRRRLLGPNGLTVEDAVFSESSIRSAVARCAVGLGFSQKELAEKAKELLIDSGELTILRKAADPEHRLWTTKTNLAAERDVAVHRERHAGQWVDATGKAGTGKSSALGVAVQTIRSLDGAPIPEALKAMDRLNREQKQFVHAVVSMCRPEAGSVLKTFGVPNVEQVVVVSTAAATAERTGKKVKADAWGSVESVLSRVEKGTLRLDQKTLLVIEEAGQLDNIRAQRLLNKAAGCRVVTLGDTEQLGAIGSAGWYGDSLRRYSPIELREVKRQKDPRDTADYDLVRYGRADAALRNLEERGRVKVSPNPSERLNEVMTDYRGWRNEGRRADEIRIVVDGSNHEVDTANRFVQRDRLRRGEVGPAAVEVENRDGRRWELRANDHVIMLETVRVRGREPVKNGTTGVLERVDENRAVLQLDDGSKVSIPPTAAIGLAYAGHIQKLQGSEAPIVQVMPGALTSRNAGYTMLTRATEQAHVYVSGSVDGLAEKWKQSAEKRSAHSVLREQEALPLPPARTDELVIEEIEVEAGPAVERDPFEVDPWVQPDPWQQEDPWSHDPWDQSDGISF